MKRIITIVAAAVTVLCATSCGISSAVSNNVNETKVVLSENNFEVVGQAYGEASATYILGIGGLSKRALYSNAIDEMTRNAELTGSQTLVNITTSTSIQNFWVYNKITCIATATVIEFK